MKVKCRRVEVRLSNEEHERLKRLCNELGLNKSEYIRYSINKFIPDRKLMSKVLELIYEIRGVRLNISQIAKYANKTGIINEVVLKNNLDDLKKIENLIIDNLLNKKYGSNESMED